MGSRGERRLTDSSWEDDCDMLLLYRIYVITGVVDVVRSLVRGVGCMGVRSDQHGVYVLCHVFAARGVSHQPPYLHHVFERARQKMLPIGVETMYVILKVTVFKHYI